MDNKKSRGSDVKASFHNSYIISSTENGCSDDLGQWLSSLHP